MLIESVLFIKKKKMFNNFMKCKLIFWFVILSAQAYIFNSFKYFLNYLLSQKII